MDVTFFLMIGLLVGLMCASYKTYSYYQRCKKSERDYKHCHDQLDSAQEQLDSILKKESELQCSNSELQGETDEMRLELEEVSSNNRRLQLAYKRRTREYNKEHAERCKMEIKYQQRQEDLCQGITERDQMLEKLNTIIGESNRKLDKTCNEVVQLNKKCEQLKAERSNHLFELSQLFLKYETCKQKLGEVSVKLDKARKKCDQLQNASSQQKQEIENVRRKYDQLLVEHSNRKEELDKVSRALNKSREETRQKCEQLKESINQRVLELHFVRTERDYQHELHENCQKKLDNVRKQLKNVSSGRRCVICFERESIVLLQPCKHLCLCKECLSKLEKQSLDCPCCRSSVESSEVIFVP